MEAKHTPGPWFPVQYAGFWHIQTEDYYTDSDVLNEDHFNEAEYNAKLCASAPDLLAENQKLKQEKEELVEMLEEAEQLFTEIRRSLSLHPDCVENSEFQDLAYGSQEMEEKILSLIQNCIGK